jgi:transposase
MGRPRSKLDVKKQGARVLALWESEDLPWKQQRLNVIRLGLAGELTMKQIAHAEGISIETVRCYFKAYREGGIKALLHRDYKDKDKTSRLTAEAKEQMHQGLKEGRWRTAKALWHWLTSEHGIDIKPRTAYHYLGKLAARLKVPRPSHTKKDPQAEEAFRKSGLKAKFKALSIPSGTKVRLWVMDEGRFGLISFVRRVWTLIGHRVVVPTQRKYEWEHVHGLLEVGPRGASEFCYLPTTNREATCAALAQAAESDPHCTHVVIYDGSGAHPDDGDPMLPANVRIIKLPPYCPELNPVEKIWDMMRDDLCNRAFATLDEMEEALTQWLKGFWKDTRNVTTLIGRGWLWIQANAC